MRMRKEDFELLYDKIDNGFVGGVDSAYQYQKFYAPYFHGKNNVLDIGCGKGAFLKALQENGIKGTGIDTTQENVDYCREQGYLVANKNAFEYLGMAGRINGEEGVHDGMAMFHMIEHFNTKTAVELLVLMHEGLKTGGVVVIVTPNFQHEDVHKNNFWLSSTHVRPYPEQWLRNAFGYVGFDVLFSGADTNSPLDDTYIVGVKR